MRGTGSIGRQPAGLVLFPGASAGRDHPGLVALDEAVSPLGIVVERADFPYRLAGRRAPDRPDVLVAAVAAAAGALAARLDVPGSRIALGGRSMGGRMCSIAVAGGLAAAGLVLVSYPLHPPGRPEQLRTAHLRSLALPCLFVSGSRDSFGSPDELEAATALVPGPVDLVVLDGGDHGLARRAAVAAEHVAGWLSGR